MMQRRSLPVLALVLFGIVLGGVVGAWLSSLSNPSYGSLAILTLRPDSSIGTTTASGSPDSSAPDATSFVQGELILLNGTPLKLDVQRQLKLMSTPAISATQIGTTFSVNVTASAPTQEQAQAVASSTIATYTRGRTGRLSAAISSAQGSVDQQLTQAVASLIPSSTAGAGSVAASQNPALQAEYQRLLQLASALRFSATQVGQVVQVVQPPTAQGPTSSRTRTAFLGALVGAVFAIGLVLARRASVRTVQTAEDLAEMSVPLLLPVVPRLSAGAAASGRDRSLRLLSARVGSGESTSPGAIVVTGATAGGGTSLVAAALAGYLAERGPVLLVLAARESRADAARVGTKLGTPGINDLTGPVEEASLRSLAVPSSLAGVQVLTSGSEAPDAPQRLRRAVNAGLLEVALATGATVVVDAPALTSSTVALDLGRRAGRGVVLVVGSGVARPEDVAAAIEIFDATAVELEGVVLNRPRRRRFSLSSPVSWPSPRAASQQAAPGGPDGVPANEHGPSEGVLGAEPASAGAGDAAGGNR